MGFFCLTDREGETTPSLETPPYPAFHPKGESTNLKNSHSPKMAWLGYNIIYIPSNPVFFSPLLSQFFLLLS
jgi:hypothetical protein